MTLSTTKIMAVLTAHPGKAAELKGLLLEMAPHCRAEPGNLRWDIWHDPTNEGRFALDELYRDAAAVAAHRSAPHYQAYLAKVPELAHRTAVVLDVLDVR